MTESSLFDRPDLPGHTLPWPIGHLVRAGLATLLIVVSALGAGCGLMPPADLRPPEVAVADLTLTDIGLDRLKFKVLLQTTNPNDLVLPLTNVTMKLTAFGVELADGYVVERRLELPALGTATVPVEFTVPTSRLLDLLDRFRASNWDNFDYRLAGSANWGNTPFSVPFERTGNLDVLKRLSRLLGGG
jgi:LEA14-like dessication related protein